MLGQIPFELSHTYTLKCKMFKCYKLLLHCNSNKIMDTKCLNSRYTILGTIYLNLKWPSQTVLCTRLVKCQIFSDIKNFCDPTNDVKSQNNVIEHHYVPI